MKLPEIFKEYVWLVNTIRRSRNGLSLSEINEEWVKTEMSGGLPMARNTFLRHKQNVEEMFGIFIECDPHNDYRYYIGNSYVLQQSSIQNWLLRTLTVGNIISESRGLQERILLEDIMADSHLLEQLMTAMQQGRKTWIDYRKYQPAETRRRLVEPYCLKLFHQRWYLLARQADGQFRVFALDRIRQIDVSKHHFAIDPAFDAEDYFSECYGVVTGDGTEPCSILLRAYGREQYALQDLPLHHTQRIVSQEADHTDFELTLRPTSDFIAHLLSRGRWLKVIRPQALADEVRRQHLAAAE